MCEQKIQIKQCNISSVYQYVTFHGAGVQDNKSDKRDTVFLETQEKQDRHCSLLLKFCRLSDKLKLDTLHNTSKEKLP